MAKNTMVNEIAINGCDTSIYNKGKGFELSESSFFKHPSSKQKYGVKLEVSVPVIYLDNKLSKSLNNIMIKDNFYKDGTEIVIK